MELNKKTESVKWHKWLFAIVGGVAALLIWYYALQLLGVKDDKSINYFKNLYNYTVLVALLTAREVFRYFKRRENKSV